jgi:acyl-CoA synthetase (AMP-forming)/AMP-acid ligase II
MSTRLANPPPLALTQRWRAEGWWSDQTLADRFDAAAQAQPDARLTIVSAQRPAEITLAAFNALSRRVAGGLAALGVGPGDVVAVQSPNWLEGMAVFAGALRLGAIVTPIVHIYGPSEVDFILEQTAAKVLVTPERFRGADYRQALRPVVERHPGLAWVVIGEAEAGAQAFDSLAGAEPWTAACPADASDVALLIYTSGTTSAPKGVQHTHQTLGAEMRAWRAERGSELAPGLCAWPIGHIAGFLGFLRYAGLGDAVVFMDVWNGVQAAELIERHQVRCTAGTPLHIGSMLDAAEADGRDLSSLIDYQAGATTIPGSLVERCEGKGLRTYRCYGSSEHPSASIGSPDDPFQKRLTTDGRLAPAVEIRLVDDAGDDVPAGAEGEIALRGPDQFVGYRDASLDADAFLPEGWFRTGDIGRLDAEGYLSITDRKKDVIIRGGENISSREVEDHLLAHPGVLDAAAVGRPHERLGEQVCACVVLATGETLELADLASWFAQRGVARQKTPEHLLVLSELPKNASGKVIKSDIRAMLRD